MGWLFEARKRYGLSILNYMVTSNHVHLLVSGDGNRKAIPKSIQLLAGKTGQEYNQRKKRKGAFWEDRYHATAVEKKGVKSALDSPNTENEIGREFCIISALGNSENGMRT